ncbi:acyltransferase family protein [Microbacterium oryzae]|uniref:acyltransferase family protein n=1 Tax=Microbacterium oryzae TaxID=743009 RepID=UPI001563B5BD|nr:acyltransferase [Microbacterium oryzae]
MTTTLRPATRTRLDTLTSLRFFAALYVVLHHTFGPDDIPLLHFGYLGVTFFFVLSGFVLTWSNSTRDGAVAFYRNRWARVWPLQIVTLIIAALLPYAKNDNLVTFMQNVTLTQAWTHEAVRSFNWVSWSISNEAFFYLLFPIALAVIARLHGPTLVMTGVATAMAQVVFVGLVQRSGIEHVLFLTYDFPAYRLGEFIIGICLARWMQTRGDQPDRGAHMFWVLALFCTAAILALGEYEDQGRALTSVAILPGAVALIHWAVTLEKNGGLEWLRARPLVKLGEWSFALYLVHMLVLRPIAAAIGLERAAYFPVAWGIVAVVLCVAASALASELVEKPLERVLRSPRRPIEPRAVTADPM